MIEIYTLGTFSLIIDGKIITDSTGRTNKLWKLLNILVASRGKPLSISRITQFIWPDEDAIDCVKSLHNLIFRLRKVLNHAQGGKCLVHYCHNSYALVMEDQLYVDAYEFEDNCCKANLSDAVSEKNIHLLEKTLPLYKGKYLMGSYDEAWALTQTSRYRRMYIEAVVALSDIYLLQEKYEDAIRLCETAIIHEPLEEVIYERLIRSLQLIGQKMQAISVCENLFELLYRDLGVRASHNINDLYRKLKGNILQFPCHNTVNTIRTLVESDQEKKAFACGMDTFKSIYRYEARQSLRRGESVFVALLTITDKNRNTPDPDILNSVRPCLFESCLYALRRGDVVSNYSSSQVIVLLAGFANEHGDVVWERIKNRFRQLCHMPDVLVEFETKPMSFHTLEESFSQVISNLQSPLSSNMPLTTRRPVGSMR